MRPTRLALSFSTLAWLSIGGCTYQQHYDLGGASEPPDASGPSTIVPTDPDADTCASSDDPHNCGTCGHDCLGGACRAGVCQPVTLARGEEIHDLAIGETDAYWINEGGDVRSVALAGGSPVTLATGFPTRDWTYADIEKGAVTQDAEHVYFAISGTEGAPFVARIARLSKATRVVDVIVESPWTITSSDVPEAKLGGTVVGGAYAIHVAGNNLHWTTWEYVVPNQPPGYSTPVHLSRLFERFHWCPVADCSVPESRALLSDGGEVQRGYERPSTPHWVDIGTAPGAQVLLADVNGGNIARVEFPSQLETFLLQPYLTLGLPRSITSDEKSVYVVTPMDRDAIVPISALVRASEGSVTALATGTDIQVVPNTVGVDATHVYWSNASRPSSVDRSKDKNAIMRCEKDGVGCGNSPEVLVALEDGVSHSVHQLSVRGGAVYWATSTEVKKLAAPAPTKAPEQK